MSSLSFSSPLSLLKKDKSMEQVDCREEYTRILFQIPLFNGLPENLKPTLLERLTPDFYVIEKGDVIARQNTPCRRLYVLLKGKLRVDIVDALGNEVMIENIIAARAFATPHLFSKDNTLPATFTVVEEGILMSAPKDALFHLISENPQLLRSFLSVTGNCNHCTTTRLRVLSYKNIRSRFVTYLLEHHITADRIIHIEHNQVQLADYLCVTRPALSKEINRMEKEGLIQMEGKKVKLLNMEELKKYL